MPLLLLLFAVALPPALFGAPEPQNSGKSALARLFTHSSPTAVQQSNGPENIHIQLVTQAKSADPKARVEAVTKIRDLLSKSTNADELPIAEFVSAGAVPTLVNCLDSSDESLRSNATWALANIAVSSADVVFEAGAVPLLVPLLSSPNMDLCKLSVSALKNLCFNDTIRARAIYDAGAMPRLKMLLKSENADIRTKTVQTIGKMLGSVSIDANLVDVELIQTMMENGYVTYFCNLIGRADQKTTAKVLNGIRRILNGDQRENVRKMIDDCGGLDRIKQLGTKESEHLYKMLLITRQPITREILLKNVDPKYGEDILNTIVNTTDTFFDDVEENLTAKDALEENVVLPSLNPGLFKGLLAPAKAILLFGPPGNGKTMLAKAVANECLATFFTISASTIVSRWYGESERFIKALFQMARNAQPSIIFIDEIDSLLRQRSLKEGEAERRIKTELLVQMDGCSVAASSDDRRVLVLAATNRPQELDEGALRRFTKRIFIDLPDEKAREKMIRKSFERNKIKTELSEEELKRFAAKTATYSFSDLTALCRAAAFCLVKSARAENPYLKGVNIEHLRAITLSDLECAIRKVKPSTNAENRQKLVEFAELYAES